MKSVRITSDTRQQLRQRYRGKPDSATVAALAGRWESRQTDVVATDGTADQRINVISDCHTVLARLQERMAVDRLGDVVATLVAMS